MPKLSENASSVAELDEPLGGFEPIDDSLEEPKEPEKPEELEEPFRSSQPESEDRDIKNQEGENGSKPSGFQAFRPIDAESSEDAPEIDKGKNKEKSQKEPESFRKEEPLGKEPAAFQSFKVSDASFEEGSAGFTFEEQEPEKKKGPIEYDPDKEREPFSKTVSRVLFGVDIKSIAIKTLLSLIVIGSILILLFQDIWAPGVPDPAVQTPTWILPLAVFRTFKWAPVFLLISILAGASVGGGLSYMQRVNVKRKQGNPELEMSGNSTYGRARFASDKEMEGKARVPGSDEDYIKQAVQFDPPNRPSGLAIGYNRVLNKVIVDHANNMNVAVYGASGSGKTFTFVKPNILMCIDNGFSFVTSDPSGELFRDTSMLAEKQGFEVRVLNIKHIFASNGWDFLMPIKLAAKSDDPSKSGTAETLADQLVTVVMENATGDQKSGDNYFQQIAGNLFLFLIRYVAMSPNFAGREEERTIGTCYDILVQLQGSGGDYPMFDELPPTDPAYAAWKTFKGLSDNQKSSAMSGLEGALHVFNNDTVKEAFAHNEIDLSLPGKKPCAYYLVTSVSDSTFRFIQSLFFSMIFQSLIEEGEQRPDNKLQVPVYFLLDEFKAIGRIKDFESKIANVRKYGISISIIFQDPSQMDSSYGDDAASILANCAVHVILGVNDIKSAKTISERVGVATVRNHSSSSPRAIYSPFSSFVTSENVSSADGKRNLLNPDEIMELSSEGRTLIIAQGMKPYLAKPYPFLKHWLAKYMTDDMKRVESEFVPPWQKGEKLMSKKRTFKGEIQDTQEARDAQANDMTGAYEHKQASSEFSLSGRPNPSTSGRKSGRNGKTVIRKKQYKPDNGTHATPDDDEDKTGNRHDMEEFEKFLS